MSLLRPRNSGSSDLPTHGGGGGGGGSNYYGNSGGPYASGGANYGGYNSSSDMMMGMQDESSDNKYHKKKQRNRLLSFPPTTSNSTLGEMVVVVANVVFVVLALVFTILWLRVSGEHHGVIKQFHRVDVETNLDLKIMMSKLRDELKQAQRTDNKSARSFKTEMNRKYQPQINTLERENRYITKDRDELRLKHEGPGKKEEETRMKSREEAFIEQVGLMQQAIKKESKRTLLERYV
jgi:hypothetical protein